MRFTETPLRGAWLIELTPHRDDRGFFARTFADEEFEAHGLPVHFPHCNLSRNDRRATLRGLHYNAAPHGESKLVRALSGSIWDVIVDLRKGSPTFLRHFGATLTEEKGQALFVPEGFAHGFITLSDATDVFYMMAKRYTPGADRGLRWNEPKLKIDWPIEPLLMNNKDQSWPAFDEALLDA